MEPPRYAESVRPGKHSWRRWKATRKLSGWLYVTGITSNGGSVSYVGGDLFGGVYTLPSWSLHHRPYVLGQRDWWWRCLIRQFPRFTHRPGPEVQAFGGYCGTCDPWWCCGVPDDNHRADCPEYGEAALTDGGGV